MGADGFGLSLKHRNILVTGVSRSRGIGATIAKMLAKAGANVVIHGYPGFDRQVAYKDAVPEYATELMEKAACEGLSIHALRPSDLSEPGIPEWVISESVSLLGYLDGLVLNHAYSTCAPVGEWTAEHIDAHLHVNVRAAMLMLQAFTTQLPEGKPASVTMFTSGQYLGPMINEIAYAVSKDAIIGLCRQTAVALAPKRIRVNCINPGPTDTGYLRPEDEIYRSVAGMFPGGEWGMPEDAARLALFLQSDEARWITGQIISSEGGFQRG